MDYPDTKLEDNVAASVLSVRPLWSDDISISAEINGEAISFLIDSGSAVLILVESKIEKCFAKKGIVLSQPPETLLDYNRKVIEGSGCFSAFTKVGVTSVEIRLYVPHGKTLLGLDAIHWLNLCISGRQLKCSTEAEFLSERYSPALNQMSYNQ